ncbi:MAG: sensor histidine kinase [Citromicrobium sp.]|nr:sensor histidine kinase [Citromicrobium sp.]MBD75493.1 sensor histidine kinase [Citromicrobium sp.]|tara:strand:- start:251 stop:1633 length:1383 start_codon:yes stop_codon:yes gene_type:complete
MEEQTYIAHAHTDANDRLVAADEPLAALQRRCGGEIPGTIAIPELREQVRKARRTNLRLGRTIHAYDGSDRIKAWMEIVPGDQGESRDTGCSIGIVTWQASPPPVERDDDAAQRRDAIDDALAELHARLDPDQRVLTVHTEAEDLQPLYARMSENLGKVWTDFVQIDGSQHAQPLHWRLLDQARVVIDGSPRNWTARLIPLGEPTPGSQGFELYLIANRAWVHRTERRDRRAEDGASIGRDLTPILRQPIARIVANAETIRSRLAGPIGDEYSDYARDIVNAGQHLLSLVDDLTDLEVVESDGFRAAPDAIDLADVAQRAAGILAVRAQEKRITIAVPPQGATQPATAEFRRVLQVLLNLVGNAIRYSPEGSTITIALGSDGAKAHVSVRDEGPGLDEQAQRIVFNKFERLGRSGGGGSGLGLYISKRLAHAMGGDLTLQSRPGEGATFTLSVPIGNARA